MQGLGQVRGSPAALALLAVVLCGCNEYDVVGAGATPAFLDNDLENTQHTDRIVQVAADEVDVLWVIDNSCSMRDEQHWLSYHFPIFMAFFTDAGALDYHVGVVSTDMDDPTHRGRLRQVDDRRWIDQATEDPEAMFTSMAEMGISGSGFEKGIATAHAAIVEGRSSFNRGFLRDTSNVHVIVISDENDHTDRSDGVTVPGFSAYLNDLKTTRESVTFSSIVTPADCFCPPWQPAQPGTRYLETTAAVGGITWNIQSQQWEQVLYELGVAVSGLGHEFFLSRLPVISTLEVVVIDQDGTETAYVEGEDWAYDMKRNSIVFHEVVPLALSEVMITYTEQASLQKSW